MIQKRPNKRLGHVYLVRLRNPDGKTTNKTFRTKAEAKLYENQQRVELARGTWTDPRGAKTKFDEFALKWLKSNPAKRDSCLARDEIVVRVHLNPVFGTRNLGSIRPADVQALVGQWITAGFSYCAPPVRGASCDLQQRRRLGVTSQKPMQVDQAFGDRNG